MRGVIRRLLCIVIGCCIMVAFAAVAGEDADRASAAKELGDILAGFPEKQIAVELAGEPGVDDSGEKVVVRAAVSVDEEETAGFIKRLDAFLERVAEKKRENVRTALNEEMKNGTAVLEMKAFEMRASVKECQVSVLSRVNAEHTIALWKVYDISPEMAEAFAKNLAEKAVLTADLIGGGGKTVASKSIPVASLCRSDDSYGNGMALFFASMFVFQDRGYRDNSPYELVPGPVEYTLEFDGLSPEEIRSIREVKLSLQKKQ